MEICRLWRYAAVFFLRVVPETEDRSPEEIEEDTKVRGADGGPRPAGR